MHPFFIRKKEEKKKLKIHVSLCTHRVIEANAVNSLLYLIHWQDPKVQFSSRKGDALIDRSRSIESSKFYLDTDADVMLFLDQDIIYKPEEVVRMCVSADEKQGITGGAYILKTDKGSFITSKPLNNEKVRFQENGPLVEFRYVATGCMAIPRTVFTRMVNEMPEDQMPLCHPDTLKFYPFFQPFPMKMENGKWVYLSEDWAFCERWRRLGGKVWMDTSIRLGHEGSYIYELDDLNRKPKEHCPIIDYQDFVEFDTSH